VVWFVVAIVVGSVVQVVLVERRQRELQRRKFQAALRTADQLCRIEGWALLEASFKPGWRWGRGSISWQREGKIHTSPVSVDGAACTREAAKLW